MVEIIKSLKVRGAPLIGAAAAFALAQDFLNDTPDLPNRAQALKDARPTAINLANAISRMLKACLSLNEALKIFDEEVEASQKMAQFGKELIDEGDNILTHCNTGGLATVGLGTALALPIFAHLSGRKVHVFVDETRPLLQGARLNTWELTRHGVSHTLICDNMAASLMAAGKIQKIFVGADRIAMNGDFANKIGTYNLAVLAHFHRVPFYVVAPTSTIDKSARSALDIPVEERDAAEVKGIRLPDTMVSWAMETSPVWNPAFDRTPWELVTAIVTEKSIVRDISELNYQKKEVSYGI